jgi:hypothetical protein
MTQGLSRENRDLWDPQSWHNRHLRVNALVTYVQWYVKTEGDDAWCVLVILAKSYISSLSRSKLHTYIYLKSEQCEISPDSWYVIPGAGGVGHFHFTYRSRRNC